jgi:uncharacterized protein YukE
MALDPPMEVVQLLQFIGVDWPMINEDTVREVAGHVQEFADNIEQAHRDATDTIQRMGGAYQGASYELLIERWSQMSSSHMTELLDGCKVVVTALDAAADFIIAQKGVAIAELVVLAVSFVADQAAAVATFGLAEAALAAIELAARKAIEFLEQQLEQYILAQVIEAGFKALQPVIERALDGFVFQAASAALGVPSSGSGSGGGGAGGAVGSSFQVIPEELRSHAQVLHGHADTVIEHAQALSGKLTGVSFE